MELKAGNQATSGLLGDKRKVTSVRGGERAES